MNSDERRGVYREFSFLGFLWRLGAALVLVLSTYNPTRFSYYGWLSSGMREHSLVPGHFVVGVILIIGWSIFVVAARRSLGTVGLVLAGALIGGIVWWLSYVHVIAVGSVQALTWVSLIALAILLAVGLSWSHVWRRLTGQYEVDETGD